MMPEAGAIVGATLVVEGEIPTVAITRRVFDPATRTVLSGDFEPFIAAHPDSRLLFIRTADPRIRPSVDRLLFSGKKYVFLTDDNLWLLLGNTPLDLHYQHHDVRACLEKLVRGAAVVLCHTEIARKFLRHFNRNVEVIPCYFDFSLIEGVERGETGEIRIGMVYNESKARELDFVLPIMRELLQETPDRVVFEFIGDLPPQLQESGRVRRFDPIPDYAEYIRFNYRRRWRIGLAPLIDTPFSRYKTNNKFREFGGCGIAGIYSDIPLYRDSVRHGRTGWLVPNRPEAWKARILEAVGDPGRTAEVARRAHAFARARYNMETVRRAWAAPLRRAFRSTSREKQRSDRLWDEYRARPEDAPQYFVSGRPTYPLSPEERAGIYGRGSFLVLHPGEEVRSTLLGCHTGTFQWKIVIFTLGKVLAGRLAITVFEGRKAVHSQGYAFSPTSDGDAVPIRFESKEGVAYKIQVANEAPDVCALAVLGSRFPSTYVQARLTVPATFVV